MRARVAACRRALAPWLLVAIIALAATALCVGLLAARTSPLHVVDLPLAGALRPARPGGARRRPWRSPTTRTCASARQRSEVESLLAIMRDVHAAAGTEAAAGVLLEHVRLLVGAAGAALVLQAADGRVLRAQVDSRERARRSFTSDTTAAERALLAELAHVPAIDLDQERRRSPHGPHEPRPAGGRSPSPCAATRGSSGCSRSSAPSRSGRASGGCSRPSARTPAARSRAARPHARWPPSPSSRSGSRTRRATTR